jgi:hypothetical protein
METNKPVWWAVLGVASAAGAVIVYLGLQKIGERPQRPVAPPAAAPSAPQADTEPQIRYPVRTEQRPLPPLNESDAAMSEALVGLLGDRSLEALLNPQGFVRRVVATVDNLARKKVSMRLMPVKPVGGTLLATGGDDGAVIGPENPARYSRYVSLLEAIDTKKLATIYVYFYPLFQEAYQELGYPNGHFNDRLVDVIDNLLAAPEMTGPVKVLRPKVFYEFADPELEALSAGQKILVRIGPANASKVKAKLQEIRNELVSDTTSQEQRPR